MSESTKNRGAARRQVLGEASRLVRLASRPEPRPGGNTPCFLGFFRTFRVCSACREGFER